MSCMLKPFETSELPPKYGPPQHDADPGAGFRVWDIQKSGLPDSLFFVRCKEKRGEKLVLERGFLFKRERKGAGGGVFSSLPGAPAVTLSLPAQAFSQPHLHPVCRESNDPSWTCNPLLKGLLAHAQLSRGGFSFVRGRVAVWGLTLGNSHLVGT